MWTPALTLSMLMLALAEDSRKTADSPMVLARFSPSSVGTTRWSSMSHLFPTTTMGGRSPVLSGSWHTQHDKYSCLLFKIYYQLGLVFFLAAFKSQRCSYIADFFCGQLDKLDFESTRSLLNIW